MIQLPNELLLHHVFRFLRIKDNVKLSCFEYYDLISKSSEYVFIIPLFKYSYSQMHQAWNHINSTVGKIGKPNIVGFKFHSFLNFADLLVHSPNVNTIPCKFVDCLDSSYGFPHVKVISYWNRIESLKLDNESLNLLKML